MATHTLPSALSNSEAATPVTSPRTRPLIERLARRVPELSAFEFQLPGEPAQRFGQGDPRFRIEVKDRPGLEAVASGDETAIAEAYMGGHLDFEGEMIELFHLRHALSDRHPLCYGWWVVWQARLFGQVRCDARWIAQHYDYDQEFYLKFLDREWRAYSQGIFADASDTLEAAIQRKLEFVWESCRLRAGQRVLDIGGGWGAFAQYAGSRGVRVTSLTLSAESERFVQRLIDENGWPVRIVRQHFFEHETEQPYDAIVNLGVTEHLPDYRRSLAQYLQLLKPGGRLYLDASACREKHTFSSFIYRYIYPGNPTPMCFKEYIREVERTPFEILEVQNDRRSYELTARRWAENLDWARAEVVQQWGEVLYRKFRLYLWGTAHAFATNLMTAYRLVLERPAQTGMVGRHWR